MPATTPQDHKSKDEPFTFTVGSKTYKLPKVTEEAATSIPGEITYNVIMHPDDEMAQLRLAFATLESCKPQEAAMKALKSLSTREMIEVLANWMGESSGSSD